MKKVLVLGAGGREHAIARALSKSSHVEKVFVAPGNPGMELSVSKDYAPIECVTLDLENPKQLAEFALEQDIALTVAGPENVIVAGAVDEFRKHDLLILGPTKAAAQMESSKQYAKEQMQAAGVKCAAYEPFVPGEEEKAIEYLRQQNLPIVVKDDGLAAGKGVIIAQTYEEAEKAVRDMLGDDCPIIIEDFLEGEEFSFFTLVNGTQCIPLFSARDYKRAYDHDEGLNTGGMGAFSSVPYVDEKIEQQVQDEIVSPLMKHLVEIGNPYTGVLYTGGMITKDGIYVIEFNARFGDPETQILLPLIESDVYELFEASVKGEPFELERSTDQCLGVVLASKGYPSHPEKGQKIHLPEDLPLDDIYFAGVTTDEEGDLAVNGGRILMVTSKAPTLSECRKNVYNQIKQLEVADTFYRTDIGAQFVEEMNK